MILGTLRMLMAWFDVRVTLSSSSAVLVSPSLLTVMQANTLSCRFFSVLHTVSRDSHWFESHGHTFGGLEGLVWLDMLYYLKCHEDKYLAKDKHPNPFYLLLYKLSISWSMWVVTVMWDGWMERTLELSWCSWRLSLTSRMLSSGVSLEPEQSASGSRALLVPQCYPKAQ